MADQEPDALYDTDVAAWAGRQAGALRRRAANEVDWDNVAKEIEDVERRSSKRLGLADDSCPWSLDQVLSLDFLPEA